MGKNEFSLEKFFKTKANFNNVLLLEGLIVGLFAGLIACLYRFLLSYAETICYTLVSYVQKNSTYIIGLFIILILIAFIISLLLKYEPYISGSGIPQVEAEMIDKIDEKWYRVIIAKMIAGTLAIIGGLSLGREGPSIQLGAMVGKGVAKAFKRIKVEEKFLLTCGAAAGLSAAFNAPLAGVLFALEEIHKNFSPLALVSVMVASLTGDFISKNLFGMTPSLYFPLVESLPLGQYGFLIVLGIITGVLGVLYNKMTMLSLKMFDKITCLKSNQKIIIALLISGIIMVIYPQILCGGHHIIDIIHEGDFVLTTLLALLLFKFLFSLLSFGSGAPGGIFFPLLVLGSLVGCVYGMIVIQYFGVNEMYFNNYIVVAMAGLFAGIVRAPITGIVLIAEMCGSLSQFLPISICAFMGYVVANLLKSEPIYHSLLHRLIQGKDDDAILEDKIVLHYSLELGSCCLDLAIKDIGLPKECLIIAITRGIDDIVPRGDTILRLGDHLTVLVDKENIEVTKDILHKFFSIEYE